MDYAYIDARVRQNFGGSWVHTHLHKSCHKFTLPWPKLPMGCRWTSDTFGLKVPALSSTYHCKGTVKKACGSRDEMALMALKNFMYTDEV